MSYPFLWAVPKIRKDIVILVLSFAIKTQCNQFGGQEPGTDNDIESFCAVKGVKNANVFTKGDVNGPNTR